MSTPGVRRHRPGRTERTERYDPFHETAASNPRADRVAPGRGRAARDRADADGPPGSGAAGARPAGAARDARDAGTPRRAGEPPSTGDAAARRTATSTVAPAGSVRVELAGQRLWLSTLRAAPQRWARLFVSARRNPGYARCLCTPAGQKLVIREVGDHYLLARWPDTSDEHVPGCPFFTSRSRSYPGHGRTDPAITALTGWEEDTDGHEQAGTGVHVHLRARFTSPVLDAPGDLGDALGTGPHAGTAGAGSDTLNGVGAGSLGVERVQHDTVTLLGLAHYLWDAAGLSSYASGERRRWDECHEALAAALLTVHLGPRAHPVRAPELLHVVRPYRPERASTPAPGHDRRQHTGARGGGRTARERPGEAADPALTAFLRALLA